MKDILSWLDNPEIFEVGVIKPHSDHQWFLNKSEIETNSSSFEQSLNGDWLFSFAEQPQKRQKEFYKPSFDNLNFNTISVPGHIELSGYGKIQYINTMYPWDGIHYRKPKYTLESDQSENFSTSSDNTVGSYLKKFHLNNGLKEKNIIIRFDGVETAMYLWLNGEFIGYSEDSFTPTEFDLTEHIIEGENILAIEVYKKSSASYLEDQDFFRFSGIFRNVTLIAKPEIHVEDIWIKPELTYDFSEGKVEIELLLHNKRNDGFGILNIYNSSHELISNINQGLEITNFNFSIKNPLVWDNQHPNLYSIELEIYNSNNTLLEVIPYKFGFRKLQIKNHRMELNNQRLILNGVNRHEWNCKTGRAITLDDMIEDMKILKRNHINAVRTSHYPNQMNWYDLCDSSGIYLMAEVNLESHGTWQKMGNIESSVNVPGNVPEWKKATLSRAINLFERFKNHTSILFWSLGNESYIGETIKEMNDYFKKKDSSRLTHYEGVYVNRHDYEDCISDIESRMYAPPEDVKNYLENNPKKPFILCEYMHDMGNSMGGLKSYMKLLDEYDQYQGGFIWDFIDQALLIYDSISGRDVLRYGGDFDDKPSDYEFSGNGIVFANREEKPAMQEVKHYYEKYSK